MAAKHQHHARADAPRTGAAGHVRKDEKRRALADARTGDTRPEHEGTNRIPAKRQWPCGRRAPAGLGDVGTTCCLLLAPALIYLMPPRARPGERKRAPGRFDTRVLLGSGKVPLRPQLRRGADSPGTATPAAPYEDVRGIWPARRPVPVRTRQQPLGSINRGTRGAPTCARGPR